MNLHLINQSAFSNQSPLDALALIQPNDKIVLTNDGVYCIHHLSFINQVIAFQASIFVLDTDINMRGLINNHPSIATISMDSLVNFVFETQHTFNWD